MHAGRPERLRGGCSLYVEEDAMKSTGFLVLPAVALLTAASCNDSDPCDGPLQPSIQGDDAIILALRSQSGIALDSCLATRFQHLLDVARSAKPEVLASIHARSPFGLRDVLVESTGRVSAAFGDGSLRTGIAELDELLAEYQLNNVRLVFSTQEGQLYKLTFDEPIHAPRLARAIRELSIADISAAFEDSYFGDGDNIAVQRIWRDWRIAFIQGEGDCPSGCLTHLKTEVLVRSDGSVQLLSEER
jgi:hypothetical protein